jgi:hypothetical protein
VNIGEVRVGSTITDGVSATRVTDRVQGGWLGIYISFASGDFTGVGVKIEDEDLPSYRRVPFEWTPVQGSETQERYVWTSDQRALRHETRPLVTSQASR